MAFRSQQDNTPGITDGHALPDGLALALAQASSEALLGVDSSRRIAFANRAAASLFGAGEEGIVGCPAEDLLPGIGRHLTLPPPARPVRLLARSPLGESLPVEAEVIASPSEACPAFFCLLHATGSRLPAEQVSTVLADMGRRLSEVSTTRDAAAVVLDTADTLFGWDCAFFSLVSEDDGRLRPVLAVDRLNGARQGFISGSQGIVPGSHMEKTLQQGAHLVLRPEPPATPPPDSVPFGSGHPSASLMFVPVRRENRTMGVLSIQSYRPHAYTRRDLDLLQALADSGGAALRRTVAEEKAARAERELREARERLQLVSRATNDAVYDWDIESGTIWWNECMETVFGYSTADAPLDIDWWNEQIHPDDRERTFLGLRKVIESGGEYWTTEYRFRRRDGTYANVYDRGFLVYRDSRPLRMIGSMMDITARKRAEEELRHGAYHDLLTGLPNRAAFLEELERAVAHAARRDGYTFAVLFLDIDRFKNINDSLGHSAGDQLLISVARRLETCIRPGDLLARLGGDEFIILVDDLKEERDATIVAGRILDCLSRPFEISGREAFASACIGIAFGTGGAKSADELLRDADTAMYRAKAAGRNRFHIFDAEMRNHVVSVLQTETDLRRALKRGEFVLHYQPVIELETGSVAGFEALVRWQHPERGLLGPADFIPVAEDSGLITPIGWWVLREACATLARWQQSDPSLADLTMSVNLSARQIAEPDLVEQVAHALRETGLPPHSLKLEITETAIMDNAQAATAVLSRLRDMHVQLHVDDFGTGHSSLGYLHRLPIHALKIDRSFVTGLGSSQESQAICSTIIALGSTMGLGTIAEGLETPEQIEHLIKLGCRYGQGYYYSRPLDARAARLYISALEP